MSLQKFIAAQQPDHDEAIGPEYDDAAQPTCDEGSQPDYGTYFA